MRLFLTLFTSFLLIPASRAAENGVLTLNQALALATERSADLAAFSYDQRAADARILQAALKPNPELGVDVENFLGTGDYRWLRESETTLSLGRLLELGGKREARIDAAVAGKATVRFDYEAKRREVLQRTAEAFVEVVGAQRRVELAEETAKLADEFTPLFQKRAAAGVSSPVETARGEVVIATAKIGVEEAKRDLAAARRALAAQWGAKEATFSKVSGNLDRRPPLPGLTAAHARLNLHPAVVRWDAEKEARSAIVSRERANAQPDITVSGGIRVLGNGGGAEPAFLGGISIPLPYTNRNQGNIAEAEALVQKVDFEKKAARAILTAQVGEAWEALSKALKLIDILEGTLLPAANKGIEAASAAYEAGRLSQLEILDARRTATDARVRLLEARIAAHKAAATLDALTAPGRPFAPRDHAKNVVQSPTRKR
jgi:cobalt-zinc-cadmium efflux system outer membrane protein